MYRGQVTAVDASGVYVLVPALHPTSAFGPLDHVGAVPAVGARVLVADCGDESTPDLVVMTGSGPTSSTDNTVARYDGTGGALQGSSVGIEDSGRITGVATPTGSTDAATKGYVDAAIPIGAVVPYAGSTAPTGWLLCYGQAVSRSTYATLFGIISTTYGTGDGSTTFNVPDLRGRVVAGLDNMGGSDAGRLDWANTLGTAGGVQNNSYADYTNGGAYKTIPGRNAMQPTMLLNHIIRAV